MNQNPENGKVKIEIIYDDRRNEWDAYLDQNDLAIAWQRYEWHDVLRKHYPHEFFPLAALNGGVICGVLPLYKVYGGNNQRQLISIPFAVAGGIVTDSPEIEQALLEHSIVLAKEHNIDSIIFKQYKHKIQGNMRTDDTYFNRELSISKNLCSIWDNLEPQNRNIISSAQKAGFTLDHPCNDIEEFYSLLLTYQHHQGIPCVSRRWIEDLVSSSMYTCAFVRDSGRVIAGTMVKTFKKTVSFPFTTLKKDTDLHTKAAYWLYWELISFYAAKGYEIIHSGRIPADEAVPCYRLGWGGMKKPYFYQYYPNTGHTTESSRKRGLKRTLFTKAWRLLPESAAAVLGPRIVRKFP